MRTQYKQILDAHTTFIALANSAVEAVETELSHASKREKYMRNELAEAREQSPRVADEAAITEYEKQLKGVHEDLLATQESEAALITERDKLVAQAEETRKIVKNYETKLKEFDGVASERLASERKAVAELMDEISMEKKAATSLQSENKKLYTDLDKARAEIGRLKQDAKKPDQQISKLIMENHDLKKVKDDLAAELEAAKLEAEEHRTALEEYKNLDQIDPSRKLHEDMHRAGELIVQAMEEDNVEKQMRHLDRALSKLGRPKPQGASA